MSVLLLAVAALLAAGASYLWLKERPRTVAKLPLAAAVLVGVAVFIGFTMLVRPVAQSEAIIGLCLGGASGSWTWWKLKAVVRSWLTERGVPS